MRGVVEGTVQSEGSVRSFSTTGPGRCSGTKRVAGAVSWERRPSEPFVMHAVGPVNRLEHGALNPNRRTAAPSGWQNGGS